MTHRPSMRATGERLDGGEAPERVAARPRWSPLWWLPLLPALGFLLFSSTGRDDVYITYWSADQLRWTGRISNYNGQALEQSSSLLQVLLLAAASWVTRLSVTGMGPWLAVVAGALCAPIACWVCGRLDARGGWVAAALVGTLPPLVYWSFGGLDTSLATLLILLVLLVAIRQAEGASTSWLQGTAVILAVVLVRPEMGPVLVAALSVAALAVWRIVPVSWHGADGVDRAGAARRVVAIAAGTTGIALLVALLRKAYFGAWVPRPVSMKVGTAHVVPGLQYAWGTVVQSRTVFALGLGVVLVASRWRALTPGWIVAVCVLAAGTAAMIIPGGDWMEGGRLLAPWMAVAMVLVGAGLGRLKARHRAAVAGVLIIAHAVGLVTYAEQCSTGSAAWTTVEWLNGRPPGVASAGSSGNWWERRNAIHVRDIPFVRAADPVLAALARVAGQRRVTFASGQAGMIIYYLQRNALRRGQPFQFIDLSGLTDDSWDGCRQGMPSSTLGKSLSWNRVLSGACGPLPDAVSGLFLPAFPQGDYTVFYDQRGGIKSAAWPGGPLIIGNQWLAIRNDLAAKVRAELQREGEAAETSDP